MFKPNGTVMMIVNLALELADEKKKVKQLERDNKCLSNLLQTKRRFEVRG
ncbi:hypothetical protein [Sulfurimonas sp.]|nr:hypothetical protein [Sulfurimonas sp.]